MEQQISLVETESESGYKVPTNEHNDLNDGSSMTAETEVKNLPHSNTGRPERDLQFTRNRKRKQNVEEQCIEYPSTSTESQTKTRRTDHTRNVNKNYWESVRHTCFQSEKGHSFSQSSEPTATCGLATPKKLNNSESICNNISVEYYAHKNRDFYSICDSTDGKLSCDNLKGESRWSYTYKDNSRDQSMVLSKSNKMSPKGNAARIASVSCLTRCKSCATYPMPVISEEESMHLAEYIALDCEFVGVGPRKTSALGRVSVVDFQGRVLLDRFVQPLETVTDYRTRWSGLRPHHLLKGIPFELAKQQVTDIIKDKIVVGHAIHNDLRVLCIPHPLHRLRDTASCVILRERAELPGNACALRKLTLVLLGRKIQEREHCSVTDARACMDLYRLVWAEWEPTLQRKMLRRQNRALPGSQLNVRVSMAGADHLEIEEDVKSYLDDQYWPADMFADHHNDF